jgi:glycosyltransferase involved in cell wall biosynthesis
VSGTTAADLRVDVIVNNFNYARFLPAAIDSALAQTHGQLRTIVVDDGSSDDSREVLHAYEDRVDLILKENGGQASALNAGMERSKGDVVIFLDADDVLHPEAASRAVAALAGDEAVVRVQGRMEVIDAAGRPTGEIKPPPHMPMPQGDMSRAELAHPFDLPWLATSANAFRAEALRRILPVPVSLYPSSGADWYLVHLTALLGNVVSLERVSAFYRVHDANQYELAEDEIDLRHLHETIRFSRATGGELLRLADELGLPRPSRLLSIADLANRMVVLRLDSERDRLEGDSRRSLVLDAARAARRRANVSAPMKAAFVAWFAAMAIAPRPLARRLATLFLFPERRRSLNHALGRLQRPSSHSAG